MMIRVMLVLFGEAMIFRFWPSMGWNSFSLTLNLIDISWFEELELVKWFGSPYQTYLNWVPPWKDE